MHLLSMTMAALFCSQIICQKWGHVCCRGPCGVSGGRWGGRERKGGREGERERERERERDREKADKNE